MSATTVGRQIAPGVIGAEGTVWTPWSDGWAVGFRVARAGRPTRYVYLNPSGGDDLGMSVVFLYAGDAGDPTEDEPVSHLVIFDGDGEDA